MFDNDDPNQRQDLIRALKSIGLNAWEFNSGGGIMHVVVPLLDRICDPPVVQAQDPEIRSYLENGIKVWPHETCLYIATNSLRTTCEVGLMGNDGRTGNQVTSAEWEHVDSLGEVVSVFQRYWRERDTWLRKLISGELAV